MKKTGFAALAAVALLCGSAAGASTIDLTTISGGYSGIVPAGSYNLGGGLTATLSVTGGFADVVYGQGLGVCTTGCLDTAVSSAGQGFTLSFNQAVNVSNLVFSTGSGNVNVSATINGTPQAGTLPISYLTAYSATPTKLTSFGLSYGNTPFYLQSVDVSAVPAVVPLPAAGFLLAGGIGGLAALRRRKRKAA